MANKSVGELFDELMIEREPVEKNTTEIKPSSHKQLEARLFAEDFRIARQLGITVAELRGDRG